MNQWTLNYKRIWTRKAFQSFKCTCYGFGTFQTEVSKRSTGSVLEFRNEKVHEKDVSNGQLKVVEKHFSIFICDFCLHFFCPKPQWVASCYVFSSSIFCHSLDWYFHPESLEFKLQQIAVQRLVANSDPERLRFKVSALLPTNSQHKIM